MYYALVLGNAKSIEMVMFALFLWVFSMDDDFYHFICDFFVLHFRVFLINDFADYLLCENIQSITEIS